MLSGGDNELKINNMFQKQSAHTLVGLSADKWRCSDANIGQVMMACRKLWRGMNSYSEVLS